MSEILSVPEKCSGCSECQIQGDSGYYPYLRCDKAMREIVYNEKNGWERMNWCPLQEAIEGTIEETRGEWPDETLPISCNKEREYSCDHSRGNKA